MIKNFSQTVFTYKPHLLDFKFDAGTSRGVLKQKMSYFLIASDSSNPEVKGFGEASPLPKLSIDDIPDFEEQLAFYCQKLSNCQIHMDLGNSGKWIHENIPAHLPSIRFAFETAILDLFLGGNFKIFDTDFYNKGKTIPINGLIWMGDKSFMLDQINEKLDQGFSCIKLKIGALDFQQECDILEYIRSKYNSERITIRVDANGAFSPEDALDKLERLAGYELHSIEQPITQGQIKEMKKLCKFSPLAIALDEELIGIDDEKSKRALLETIQPQYVILKPTLLGGFTSCRGWIAIAEEMKIGWWMTSALESNIGLNAIAQFTDTYSNDLPQGLGTGQLYHNNIPSPLYIENGRLGYDHERSEKWKIDLFL